MDDNLKGRYLWLNLAIAIFYDVGVQGVALALYGAGAASFGSTAAAGAALSKGTYGFAVFFTFLFRYLHNSRELTPYTEAKQAEARALKERATRLQRLSAEIAQNGARVEVLVDQLAGKIKGMITKALMRRIVAAGIETLLFAGAITPSFTIAAFYDLRDLRKTRQEFKPLNAQIEALKDQVENGEKIAQKAAKQAREDSKESPKDFKNKVSKARNKAKQAQTNKQKSSARSSSRRQKSFQRTATNAS